jgi:hypothetical protein
VDIEIDLDVGESPPARREHKALKENLWVDALAERLPDTVTRDIRGGSAEYRTITYPNSDENSRPYAGLGKTYMQDACTIAEESDKGRGFPLFDMVCKIETEVPGVLYDLPISVKIREGNGRREVSLFHTTRMDSWEKIVCASFPIWMVVIHDGGYTVINVRDLLASDAHMEKFLNFRERKVAISMAAAIDFGFARTFRGEFRLPRVKGDPTLPYPEIVW